MTSATCTPPIPFPPAAPHRSLADEHRALLRDVRRRADAALALVDARVWPVAEIDTLARFLGTRVLRQASDEEVLLYPRGTSAPLAELSDDHVRLHELTERLRHADPRSCPLGDLRALVEHVLVVLQRHLAAEQALLAALPDLPSDPPATASAGSWLPVTDEPVRLRLTAADGAADRCVERLVRLRPGERAVVRGGEDAALEQVCRWLHRFDPAGYGLERRQQGIVDELLVTRRAS